MSLATAVLTIAAIIGGPLCPGKLRAPGERANAQLQDLAHPTPGSATIPCASGRLANYPRPSGLEVAFAAGWFPQTSGGKVGLSGTRSRFGTNVRDPSCSGGAPRRTSSARSSANPTSMSR
jgi:hypothetical protein